MVSDLYSVMTDTHINVSESVIIVYLKHFMIHLRHKSERKSFDVKF